VETYCEMALFGQRSGRYPGLCVQAVGSGLCGQRLRAHDESALEVAPPDRRLDRRPTAITTMRYTNRQPLPFYLAADLRRLSDMPYRRSLRSSLTHQLDVRQSQCATVGDRAFATAGARFWNSSKAVCMRHTFTAELKTFLFTQFYRSHFI